MIPDHYATLGVPPTASAAAIRAAYLTLMREYHPDRNPDPAAVERAQAAIVAFKVLGDFDRRNHYDWDRRREREAAATLAAKDPRGVRAGAIGVGAVGLAAVGAWVLMPAPSPEPARIQPPLAEVRPASVAKAKPRPAKRIAAAAPVKVAPRRAVANVAAAAREAPVRLAKAGPVPPKAKAIPAPPPATRTPVVRVAKASRVKAPAPRVTPAPSSPSAPAPAKLAARPARRDAKPATDLASLDQFVMSFYGQSWRYGDAPKRAALVESRADFVVRRGACAADACKRDAYLKLMRDVSAIVETGQPKAH